MHKSKYARPEFHHWTPSEKVEFSIEDLGTLLHKILEGAAKDFSHENLAISSDAFYWVMCPRSELYSDLAERVGVPFRFETVRRMMVDLFEIPLPQSPITEIVVDTSTDVQYLWRGDEKKYVDHLASIIDRLATLAVAEVNGVYLRVTGPGAKSLLACIECVRGMIAMPPHHGFSRARHLRRVMGLDC